MWVAREFRGGMWIIGTRVSFVVLGMWVISEVRGGLGERE